MICLTYYYCDILPFDLSLIIRLLTVCICSTDVKAGMDQFGRSGSIRYNEAFLFYSHTSVALNSSTGAVSYEWSSMLQIR